MIKLLVLGNTHVGKTSMIFYYTKNRRLNDPMATIGIDFVPVKDKDGVTFAHIWDTGGLERYQSVTRHYFSGADCVMLVYDAKVSGSTAYSQIGRWYNDILDMCGDEAVKNVPIMIVGNKSDEENTPRVCTSLRPLLRSRSNNVSHMFTSAKTGKNIERAFTDLLGNAGRMNTSPMQNNKTQVVITRPSEVIHCCY